MPSGGQLSRDRVFFSTGSPHSWTEIPEIRDVTGLPNRVRDEVESTVHGTSGERSFIPGLATVNPLEFTLRANVSSGSTHMLLKQYEGSQTQLWFRAEISVESDLTTNSYVAYTMQGRVKSWELITPFDGLKEINVSVLYDSNLMFQQAMASVGV